MQQYKNNDGTYTSPKNGKIYKSEKAIRAHLSFRKTDKFHNFSEINNTKIECRFCKSSFSKPGLKGHERNCYLNPENIKLCEVCSNPIKNYRYSKGSCSHKCSNTLFRKIRNKPDNYTHYTTLCWHYHKKECIVCGEAKIVAVHHYNEDHNDDSPANLVPLCPTHHQYVHSRYKDEVIDIIDKYVISFKNNLRLA